MAMRNIPSNREILLKENITHLILQADNHTLGVPIIVIQDLNIELVYCHDFKHQPKKEKDKPYKIF